LQIGQDISVITKLNSSLIGTVRKNDFIVEIKSNKRIYQAKIYRMLNLRYPWIVCQANYQQKRRM